MSWSGVGEQMPSIGIAIGTALITGVLTLVDPKMGIAFIVFISLFYLFLRYPHNVFLFFVLSYPLISQIQKISIGDLPGISVERAVLFFLTAVVLLNKDLSSGPPISRIAMLLMAGFLLSVLYAAMRSIPVYQRYSFKILIDSYLLPFTVFYLGTKLFYNKIDAAKSLWVFLVLGAYVAAMGIAEFIFRYDFFPSEVGLRETDLYVRANGPFASSETFGLFLGICMFTVIYLKKVKQEVWRFHEICAVTIMVFGILSSMNRGITVSALCAFAMPYLKNFRRQMKLLAVGGFLFLCVALLFPYISKTEFYRDRVANFENIATRLSADLSAYAMVKDHPVAGIGLNNFADFATRSEYNLFFKGYSRPTTIHNALLDVMAEIGLLGLIPFCGIIVAIVALLIQCRKHQVDGQLTAFSVLIMYLLPFLSDNLTKDAPGNYMVAIFVAAAFSLLMKKKFYPNA
jgi:hypothetical protein